MEPILLKYRHVFHDETRNDFKSTDVIEHHTVIGDAKTVRRPCTEPRFSLHQEMDRQVKEMLDKGVIEPSDSS